MLLKIMANYKKKYIIKLKLCYNKCVNDRK